MFKPESKKDTNKSFAKQFTEELRLKQKKSDLNNGNLEYVTLYEIGTKNKIDSRKEYFEQQINNKNNVLNKQVQKVDLTRKSSNKEQQEENLFYFSNDDQNLKFEHRLINPNVINDPIRSSDSDDGQ